MGMCAEVIAIGPYSRAISKFLDYKPEYYEKTQDGAMVSRKLFGILEGSSVSREFALALGISDPWDFNQHKIIKSRIDADALRRFARLYEDYDEDVEVFLALLAAGFEFHFRPEG